MKVTRPFNIEDFLSNKKVQNGDLRVVDGQGNPVDIVYLNKTRGEKPVLCVAHRPEGTASAWVTADGKFNEDDDCPALFFVEKVKTELGWRPAKANEKTE